jgi:hypothetical protein
VQRHACSMTGTQQYRRMEKSSMNASPAKEAESVGAAEEDGERETNASGPLTAPEAAGRRETKEPCSVETAKSRGAQETNVPEERSAAVRRDGEPLANTAKRRRQKEAAADERQVATGEQPSSPVGEELRTAPPLVEDPAGWLQGAADADQRQSAAAEVGHEEAAHENSESIRRFEEILRQEAKEMLTGYLRDGTDYLSASTVRRVVQVAGMSVVGSAMAVSRLDREVRRITTTYPDENPATLADHMVRTCEEEVLDWMRTRTVHPGPDADPDPAGSPMGQRLVEDLEKTITREEANKDPPPGSKEDAWMMKVQEQATKVLCLAKEHVVTAETHLRYAEGHLQPSEEHLANAEVHLKLVKAHLAALDVAEPAEADPPETATRPPPKPSDSETDAGRAKVTPEERDRSPATRPRAGPVQRGRKPAEKTEGTPPPGAGEEWTCPVNECQDSEAHPFNECEEFKSLSVTQRRKAIKE